MTEMIIISAPTMDLYERAWAKAEPLMYDCVDGKLSEDDLRVRLEEECKFYSDDQIEDVVTMAKSMKKLIEAERDSADA